MRLLLVEDDPTLARHLQRGFAEAAWTVDRCDAVEAGWRMALLHPYDLIVLDLGLVDGDGMTLLRRLRAAHLDTPVLVLTARGAVEERIAGLNAGADDYLGKPFVFGELLARAHALRRRGARRELLVLQVADLELDMRTRRVQRGGRRLELTARELAILEILMRHAGDVVSRATLTDHVWGASHDSLSNLVEVFVNRLRKKLEADGAPRLLHTVRGAGYVLRAAEDA